MRITLVGVSHHRAPVALRERVALDLAEASVIASTLAAACGESVCLSTCNRTELYIAHDPEQPAGDAARALLLEREPALGDALYQLHDEAAALHLFRVAAGLDSLVPGEGEILGQVRLAFEAGAAGPMLGRLFRQALYAGRRARVQTAIGEAPASVSSAAAALAHQVFGDLRGRRILLVGAGKVSEQAARNLLSRGAEIAIVANRSSARAEELAGTFGASAIGLEQLEGELASADIVVASTSAPDVVVSRDQVERAVRARRGKPLLLVDLAVPRDLDP
jgi:glutamyl-tRNA reductase